MGDEAARGKRAKVVVQMWSCWLSDQFPFCHAGRGMGRCTATVAAYLLPACCSAWCVLLQVVLRRLAVELMRKLDDELRHSVAEDAAFYEHRLQVLVWRAG